MPWMWGLQDANSAKDKDSSKGLVAVRLMAVVCREGEGDKEAKLG